MEKKLLQWALGFILCFLCVLAVDIRLPEKVRAEENSIEHAEIISSSGSYSGRLDDSKDYYKFSLNKSAKITITIAIDASSGYLYIYDNEYEQLDGKYIYYDENRRCSYRKMDFYFSAGTYYLGFGSFKGTYSFILESQFADETFSESQLDPNDILSQAKDVTLDKKYAGLIGLGDEQDFYKFYVPFTGRVYISHYNYFSEYDQGKYTVLDIEGNELRTFWNRYDSDKGYAHDVDEVELKAGNYYLKVYGASGFYNFTIKIQPNPAQIARTKRNKTKATIKIERQEGVTGFVIQYSVSDKFEKGITKAKTTQSAAVKLTGLKKNKTYYVRAKAYKIWNGETYYSEYGDIITMYNY